VARRRLLDGELEPLPRRRNKPDRKPKDTPDPVEFLLARVPSPVLEAADIALVNTSKLRHLLLTQLSRFPKFHKLARHRVVGAKGVQYVLATWSEARLDLRNVCDIASSILLDSSEMGREPRS